jgi:hypothetical protein
VGLLSPVLLQSAWRTVLNLGLDEVRGMVRRALSPRRPLHACGCLRALCGHAYDWTATCCRLGHAAAQLLNSMDTCQDPFHNPCLLYTSITRWVQDLAATA